MVGIEVSVYLVDEEGLCCPRIVSGASFIEEGEGKRRRRLVSFEPHKKYK